MKEELFVPFFVVGIFVCIIVLMIGQKMGNSNSYENCIDYHNDKSVVDARILCKKIVIEGKR